MTDLLLRGEKRAARSFKEKETQILQRSGETSETVRGGGGRFMILLPTAGGGCDTRVAQTWLTKPGLPV